MKLYLLKRIGGAGYDEFNGFVIRAKSEDSARLFAEFFCPCPPSIWTDPQHSTCERVTEHGEPGILLRDFNGAG